jgi:hypothetical protein
MLRASALPSTPRIQSLDFENYRCLLLYRQPRFPRPKTNHGYVDEMSEPAIFKHVASVSVSVVAQVAYKVCLSMAGLLFLYQNVADFKRPKVKTTSQMALQNAQLTSLYCEPVGFCFVRKRGRSSVCCSRWNCKKAYEGLVLGVDC